MHTTWLCDSGSCEHETEVKHVVGSGVYCEECAARRISLAFEPEDEEAEQLQEIEKQRQLVEQVGE